MIKRNDTHRRVPNIDLVVCDSTANLSPMGGLEIESFKVYGFRAFKGSYLLSSIRFLIPINYKVLLNLYCEFINTHIGKILSIAHNKIFFINFFCVKNYKLKYAFQFTKKTMYSNSYKEIFKVSFLSKSAFMNSTKIKKYVNKNKKGDCI